MLTRLLKQLSGETKFWEEYRKLPQSLSTEYRRQALVYSNDVRPDFNGYKIIQTSKLGTNSSRPNFRRMLKLIKGLTSVYDEGGFQLILPDMEDKSFKYCIMANLSKRNGQLSELSLMVVLWVDSLEDESIRLILEDKVDWNLATKR